jgi:hypothetical protein
MTHEENLLYFKMNLINAEIEMQAMIAENKQREVEGKSPAYVFKQFMDLIVKYNIYHNAFPFYKGE